MESQSQNNAAENTADQAMALSTAQMKSVLEVSRMFAVAADLETLLHKIAHATCDLMPCERSSIWLHDPASNELYTTVILDAKQLRVPAHVGIVGAAFTANRSVNVPSAYEDPRFNRQADKATGFRTRSLLAVPMVDIESKPVGVIQAVNKKGEAFTAADQALMQLLADQAGVAIQRHRLQEIARAAAEMEREMNLARRVQQALLPAELPDFAGFDLFGWAKPASSTGGDCYDLWQLPDGRLGILLADASGHGLAPALVVSQARTLIRTLCDGSTPLPAPHDLLLRVHRRMSQDLSPERFITVFLGFLHSDGMLEWESAGHGPILARSSGGEPLASIEPQLAPINIIEEPSDPPSLPLKLQPGGMLAVLSDGISEAFNPSNELFGISRLCDSLNSCGDQSVNLAAECLLKSIQNWQTHDQPVDDQTIVLVNRVT